MAGALLGAVACGTIDDGDTSAQAETQQGLTFDVNDVSILFPLPKGANESLLDLANTKADGDLLLSAANFEAMLKMAPDSEDGTFRRNQNDDRSRWKVVAFRADPCSKLKPNLTSLTAQDACSPQLRLILQPIERDGSMRDHALHLIYGLDAKTFAALTDDLVALKKGSSVPTNGKPLGVHPGIEKEGLGGPTAKGAFAIVQKYAGEKHLQRVAIMLTLNAGHWRFAAAELKAGNVSQTPVPCSSDKTMTVTGTTGVTGNFISGIEPESTCKDNVNLIIDSNNKGDELRQGPFFRLPAEDAEKAVQAALRVDNPDLNTIATLDCGSCHVATRALARVKGDEFVDADDGNENRYRIPVGITGKMASDGNTLQFPYNVRSFGYLRNAIAYTMRTVNESAQVADFFNKNLLAGK